MYPPIQLLVLFMEMFIYSLLYSLNITKRILSKGMWKMHYVTPEMCLLSTSGKKEKRLLRYVRLNIDKLTLYQTFAATHCQKYYHATQE